MPRASEPKGEWWSVFHDTELDQLMRVVVVSNQTIKADEANYRQALALINEARAGLFPTINGTGSATRGLPGGTSLAADAAGSWTLDVWGQVRRQIEAQQAGAETNAAIVAKRDARGAIGPCACLCDVAPGGFAGGPARQDDRRLQALGHNHAEPVQRRDRRQVRRHHGPGPAPQRPGGFHRGGRVARRDESRLGVEEL